MGTTKPKTCLPKPKFSLFRAKAINREVSGRRKTQTFSRKLETNNLRLSHFRDCERLETTNNRQASTNEEAKTNPDVPGEKICSGQRYSNNDTEGCPERGTICRRTISFNNICQTEKGKKQISSHNKSETVKCLHAIHTLQDGRDEKCDRPVEPGRLHDKNRFEGCLLVHPNSSLLPKVLKISVGEETVRNASFSVWGRTRSKNLYKTAESSPNSSKETDDYNSSIPRRLTDHREDNGRSHKSQRYCAVSSPEIRLHHELGEIDSPTSSRSRILGNDDKQCQNGNMAPNREGSKHFEPLSEHSSNKDVNLENVSQPNREVTGNPTCNINSPNAGQSTTTGTHKSSTGTDELRIIYFPIRELVEGVKMVDQQFNETGEPRNDNLYRCLVKRGMGASLEGGISTGGVWTKEEKENHHINELELWAVEIALKTFLKERNPKLIHIYMDNMTALYYLIRKGGTKSITLTNIAKRIWEFLQQRGTMITASWIPSKVNQKADWRSRQKANSREWELSERVFQKLVNVWGKPEIDCFASRIMRKLSLYMSLNPDPGSWATINALYQNWGNYPYLFGITKHRNNPSQPESPRAIPSHPESPRVTPSRPEPTRVKN